MHEYSLSSSSPHSTIPTRRRHLVRSFFRAIFFGPRGNICGSCEAVDRRDSTSPRTRQVLTFRSSPSPANYACLFLPLPLLSSHLFIHRLYELLSLSFRSPSRCHHGFSLTFSRYRLSCTPIFSSPSPPFSSITWLRSPSSCFALVPTSCISSSVSVYTSSFVINY